ncbi:hypothetical protein [Roseospira visakhapatnamensis]|uniref:3-phosphoshikimate 1-carboxyvinyltransferase n=1 Tax=Roseospira visakhapatnamensis TaxID=390880 RepID=A0A7W6RB88_9PROT|nr:hypothetical protein [Roseospira visakhapatnamensis]MBB4265299.1 hypothetical protein [Roseospira visakhapatnamensis]
MAAVPSGSPAHGVMPPDDDVDPLIDRVWRDLVAESKTPFDAEQARALKLVLSRTGSPSRRHPIDIRFVIPVYFRRFYVVVLAGRDRRLSVAAVERNRRKAGEHALGGAAFASLFGGIVAVVMITGALALYGLKSLAGVDLIPGFHATDVFDPDFWR